MHQEVDNCLLFLLHKKVNSVLIPVGLNTIGESALTRVLKGHWDGVCYNQTTCPLAPAVRLFSVYNYQLVLPFWFE